MRVNQTLYILMKGNLRILKLYEGGGRRYGGRGRSRPNRG